MTCLTMFFAQALTMLALVCSIRGWWPSILFGVLHFLCLVSPWVRRATNLNHKLPLWAAECQLVYAVSIELKARRDGWPEDQSPEAVMEPIRAGMVSAVFWILVFFCSEMAAAASDEESRDRNDQHKQEHVSVSTTLHPPVGVPAPTYQWILPAPCSSLSAPQRGGATFSAICTVHLDTTTPAATPTSNEPEASTAVAVTNSPCDDDHGSHHTIAPSTVTPAVSINEDHSPALTAMTSPTPDKYNSPLAFNLDHSIPSFVTTTTTDSACVTAPLQIESQPVSPTATTIASNATGARENTGVENSKQPCDCENRKAATIETDQEELVETGAVATLSNTATPEGQPQMEEVAVAVVEPAPCGIVSQLTDIFAAAAMADSFRCEDKGPATDSQETTEVLEDEASLAFAKRPINASPKRRFMAWGQEKVAKKFKQAQEEKADPNSNEEPSTPRRTWYKRRREWL